MSKTQCARTGGACALRSAYPGGANRDRTGDLLLAKQALSHLSYGPRTPAPPASASAPLTLVGLGGLEPPTPRLSSVCSDQLSYRPGSACTRTADRCGRPRFQHVSRKEVIQPHLPIRLPCYDFTPVMKLTVVGALLAVRQPASGEPHSHGVTGGVYKARERIHRGMLIRDY